MSLRWHVRRSSAPRGRPTSAIATSPAHSRASAARGSISRTPTSTGVSSSKLAAARVAKGWLTGALATWTSPDRRSLSRSSAETVVVRSVAPDRSSSLHPTKAPSMNMAPNAPARRTAFPFSRSTRGGHTRGERDSAWPVRPMTQQLFGRRQRAKPVEHLAPAHGLAGALPSRPSGAGTSGAWPRRRCGYLRSPNRSGGATKQGGSAPTPPPDGSTCSPPLGSQSKLSITPRPIARE